MRNLYLYVIIILIALTSCSQSRKEYKIGVSQCSEDIWREKQNAELRMGAYLQGDVELHFAAAYDSDERQVQQIDSLLNEDIDLLIVAPNQVQTISPAIDRAYDRGIPVIVFERKTSSQKYTAFIGADNYEMGRVMGEYIASQLHGKGRVMEIMGLEGSSPAIERHNGFAEALKRFPNIEVVATLQGDWTEESAVKAVKAYQGDLSNIDFVFGQNDRMAMGARKTLSALNGELSTKFCGIDGLPGEDGGIRLVRDSILDASYIYPTHGDQIIELAVNILEGKPYEKETLLMSALVTRDNARVLLMQNEEMMRQSDYLDQLHHRADNYLDELDTQHLINWMSLGVIALLLIIMVLFYLYYMKKVAIQREHVVNTLWNMKPEDIPQAAAPEASESPEETADDEPVAASLFITRFKEAVEKRLDESELSVEDLAADMNLSRVQLYRKVKSYTGSTPVELVRSAFTLPRELKVTEYGGKPLVTSTVVKEIDAIAGQWQDAGASLDVKDAYQLQVTVGLDQNSTITLSNDKGEQYVIDVRGSERTVAAHRNAATGTTGFNGTFSIPSMQAPLCVTGNTVTLDIYVDWSSVELFTKEGTMAMTNLVFPGSIYNKLTVSGAVSEAKYRVLNRIW